MYRLSFLALFLGFGLVQCRNSTLCQFDSEDIKVDCAGLSFECGNVKTEELISFDAKLTSCNSGLMCGTCASNQRCNTITHLCDDVCETMCDGGRLRGLNGVRYAFTARAGHVYALVSEPTLQVNARFVESPAGGQPLVLGAVCMRTCNETIMFYGNKTVELDGVLASVVDLAAKSFSMNWLDDLRVTFPRPRAAEVTVPGRWRFSLGISGERVTINRATALSARPARGIIGRTWHPDVDLASCVTTDLCQLPGSPKDHQVRSNELCGELWTDQFSEESCTA
eukprot:TRINITY_DN15767_c0_g1_i1.p1 TRINITY_DN15767_c0_g1~~TRINITY_DN15767_c0_g1_i1.p1  ORF type:complete len:282 (+),score=44.48 TRINITY_DN15767_c0_g1_i1:97-942(+)